MQNYEVGDTVEHLDYKGDVQDTGVVTRIESVNEYTTVWCSWKYDARQRELSFPASNLQFRIKTKRQVDEITHDRISLIVDKLLNCLDKNQLLRVKLDSIPTSIITDLVYSQVQSELAEEQKKNDPEYQKYLELKEKFES